MLGLNVLRDASVFEIMKLDFYFHFRGAINSLYSVHDNHLYSVHNIASIE